MELNFYDIKKAVTEKFNDICYQTDSLFIVSVDKDRLWDIYLNTIPEENNKIIKVRREYDCSCCRHFIKAIGNVVAIIDRKLVSIWDIESGDSRWDNVAKAMSEYVKSSPIETVFLTKFNKIGTDFNMVDIDGTAVKLDHFYVDIPNRYVYQDGRRSYVQNDTIESVRGLARDTKNVFKRSLEELTVDSLNTVMEIIDQGSLYRGLEYRDILKSFLELKREYDSIDDPNEKELFAWEKSTKINPAVAKIRNTAIGTLLINISENMDLEVAVKKYEDVTAPENYKRSKPIFTAKMLEDAQNTIMELGYLDSLNRRFATVDDISINNIIFSNKDTVHKLKDAPEDIFAELKKDAKKSPKKFSRVEEISIDKFISDVIPTTTDVEVYVEGKHSANFMSLIAPENKDSKTMFKWNNNFSWAYSGNVTDSIVKQNVEKAGGDVNGVLRFSIQWNDANIHDGNDLDAHCVEPNNNHIFFSHCRRPERSRLGGQLDVDIINPIRGVPAVENITWPTMDRMMDGEYRFFVHCYSGRGGTSGFKAEIEFNGEIHSFCYDKPLKNDEIVDVAIVTLKDGEFSIKEKLPSGISSREIWGVKTNEFNPVSIICYSPNYWDEQHGIGNKHYFFMLKDCVNPESPNGFYNEFLNSELYPNHRKVMEALASKARVKESENQLSGLGFSSTLKNDLVVKVKGATDRILKIKF